MWPFKKTPNLFDQALKAHLDGDFSVFAAGDDAPSESAIVKFEQTVGCKLPGDFRSYSCSRLGGLYVEAKESIWPRLKQFEVGPFWTFLNGLYAYSFSSKAPEWMNISLQTEVFQRETNTSFVPCLKILKDADLYCFDSEGKLRRWNHETGETPLQNKTFTEIFIQELIELRKRKDKKVLELKKT